MSTPITYRNILMDRYKLIYNWLPENGKRILDLGCGNGNFTKWMVEKADVVVGMDHNPKQVTAAAKSFEKIYGSAGSAMELPFADETFDAVIMSDMIEHVPCAESAVQEAVRVLKEDGLLIASLPNTGPLSILDGDNLVNRLVWFLSKLHIPKGKNPDGSRRHFYQGFEYHRHHHFGKKDINKMLEGTDGKIDKHYYGGTFFWPLAYLWEKILEVFLHKSLIDSDYRLLRKMRAVDFKLGFGCWSYNLVVAVKKIKNLKKRH